MAHGKTLLEIFLTHYLGDDYSELKAVFDPCTDSTHALITADKSAKDVTIFRFDVQGDKVIYSCAWFSGAESAFEIGAERLADAMTKESARRIYKRLLDIRLPDGTREFAKLI